jgi:DNA-binding cell septation regulator SpoVG
LFANSRHSGSAIPLYAEQSGEIYVTSVKKSPVENSNAISVVLNDCIEVKEIQVNNVGGKIALKYPTYIAKKGKEYPQFKPLTKQAKDEIERAVSTGKLSTESAKSVTFRIAKFSKYMVPSTLKVFAAVDFNDAVRVECKILDGVKGPWVSWPARKPKNSRKWIKQVLIINEKVKNDVEKELLNKYKTMATETEEEEDYDN